MKDETMNTEVKNNNVLIIMVRLLFVFVFALGYFYFSVFELSDLFYFFLIYIIFDFFTAEANKKPSKYLVVFVVLLGLVKYFIADLYKTPTPSMTPTIPIETSFVVDKTAYGLNFPFHKKLMFQWGKPERGDIVLFYFETKNDKGKDITVPYLKRVIGVEGDVVFYDFINKKAYLSEKGNESIKEPFINTTLLKNTDIQKIIPEDKILFLETSKYGKHYIYNNKEKGYQKFDDDHITINGKIIPNIARYVVGKDEMFVMGDNRDGSYDSRFIGNIKIDKLIGKFKQFVFMPEYLKEEKEN